MNDFTKEELEKAHEDNGYCGSCGWHAAFFEMNYEQTTEIIGELKQWWDSCKNHDDEDRHEHRGCYIYTRISNE